jgi:inorganic pyrophosphatase
MAQCYPIGLITMTDDAETDEKVIAIPFNDPQMNTYSDISSLPVHLFTEIAHFFEVYKQLEHGATSVENIQGKAAAVQAIDNAMQLYSRRYTKS